MTANAKQTRELDAALALVAGPDASSAKGAARLLNRRARGNWTQANKEWLTAPSTVNALLQSLKTTDAGVAVDVIGALGALSQRYECLDPRIHDTLLPLAQSGSDLVRIAVAAAIPQFGTDAAWNAVLGALSAKPASAAQNAVGLAVARYGTTISAQLRPLFAEKLVAAAATQNNRDALSTLAKALRVVGSRSDVPALLALAESADSEFVRDDFRVAIAACESRDSI